MPFLTKTTTSVNERERILCRIFLVSLDRGTPLTSNGDEKNNEDGDEGMDDDGNYDDDDNERDLFANESSYEEISSIATEVQPTSKGGSFFDMESREASLESSMKSVSDSETSASFLLQVRHGVW